MKSILFALLLVTTMAQTAFAQTTAPKAELSGVSFLVGQWSGGKGKVADGGGTATGTSTITVEANGSALLRRDHTNLFHASGKASGGFDQIMLIYPEGGALHADYSDGAHVIHYVSAVVNKSWTVSHLFNRISSRRAQLQAVLHARHFRYPGDCVFDGTTGQLAVPPDCLRDVDQGQVS